MIDFIITYSIKNKIHIALFTIAIVVFGIYSMRQIPLDAVPDITDNQVQVITQAPNLSTRDIEQYVTYPVELEMANLPGVKEIRSISRFGLSVVTVVFYDDEGTYLPRQLVSEKLKRVSEEIPAAFGKPMLGPISTGLGEIFQYTLEVDQGFEAEYNPTDLRGIQDWIVARRMAMVEGVVEVNAFGGSVKQYEVALNPEKLRAMGITIAEVFEALEQNNANTGGAYIEKNHFANFIRGEGLIENLEDIENIAITNQGQYPIKMKDVAKVHYGEAVRYGAMTKDGKGEAVGGMILMLKGANSNAVVERVKTRMDEIQKSLPEGVRVEPFIDRSKLIMSTTKTVAGNLIEGALIVILVLVLLLGNKRGGLIVVTTIPLALLFAFILMNVFDVWANLMSLGAIDFGIIVDGAVIIVEGTVFLIARNALPDKKMTQSDRDDLALSSSKKMMNSAFFGQIIILIVFVPILALEGIEGKMFKPMALTFMFAMLGAIVLCLTYVPMMTAWFLRPESSKSQSKLERATERLKNYYQSVLTKSLKKGGLILTASLVIFTIALVVFSRLGGEFIPQLDEGDLAFHTVLKPGSSLSETVEQTTIVEKKLMAEFPEIISIMSRIGVAEVPTDPMPMDVADCIVILKPKGEWTSASTKEELVEKMKASALKIPGLNFEFTQPIEMRFNELLTGVREDIAIKLFGEDLSILNTKANEIAGLIKDIPGIGDLKVEATEGLPQIEINYDRDRLAQYGLNIAELNNLVSTAFAGKTAGIVFEGEKRFDLVVRFEEKFRQDIDHIKNTYLPLSDGSQIPLKEIADISFVPGPMQISRENTNRRTYVGINVRGRDVASLMEEISARLDENLELPPGYFLEFGGAFENLERASQRLKYLVPAALALIFVLIFLALKSLRQSAMIFVAIPLAATGGIFSLWLRDMPFSISAGIGFIVLFGVAVLNGLVLISSWNELKEEENLSLKDRILQGAGRRLRPILLTALTDVLGFLPMALSTSAGAEVQQPLATVVIGGMLTATLLTLFVLPTLYKYSESRTQRNDPKRNYALAGVSLIVFLFLSDYSAAQNNEVTTLDEAIAIGLTNNTEIAISNFDVQISELGKKSAFDIQKSNIAFQYGQYDGFDQDLGFTISQQFEFPTVYSKQRKLAEANLIQSEYSRNITQNELKRDIGALWYSLEYLMSLHELLSYEDSIFTRFQRAAQLRYESELTSYLEKVNAETSLLKIRNDLSMNQADIEICKTAIHLLLNDSSQNTLGTGSLKKRDLPLNVDLSSNPLQLFSSQEIAIARAKKQAASAKLLPDIGIGYFNQSLIGTPIEGGGITDMNDRFDGIQASLAIPIFFGKKKADIKRFELEGQQAIIRSERTKQLLNSKYDQQIQEIAKLENSLSFYQNEVLNQADLILKTANRSYETGSINYTEYFVSLQRALNLKKEALLTLYEYNQAVIQLEYIIGN